MAAAGALPGCNIRALQNCSRRFYGPVALRDALGNSLSIPALKTLQYVDAERYLRTLAALGFEEPHEPSRFLRILGLGRVARREHLVRCGDVTLARLDDVSFAVK